MNYYIKLIAIALCFSPFISIGQDNGLEVRDKNPNFHPYIYSEGKLHLNDSLYRRQDIVYAFVEGDSSFVKRYYGNLNNDTSFVKYIFGANRNKGIIFYLYKKNSSRLKIKDFKKYLKQDNVLIKIDTEPLATKEDVVEKLNISKIRTYWVVENFKLTKWDTGIEKAYTLLVIAQFR